MAWVRILVSTLKSHVSWGKFLKPLSLYFLICNTIGDNLGTFLDKSNAIYHTKPNISMASLNKSLFHSHLIIQSSCS